MDLKNRTLLVFKCLWENTDETHTISLEHLKDYLEGCGLSRPDPRTLKNDISQLIELGVDIVKDRRVQNQYFIGTRLFDTAEVKLLMDAVQSSKFITPRKSKALIRKLSTFIGPHQQQLLKRQLYVDDRAKANNEAVIRIVDHIHTAIAARRKITFQYFDYTPAKEKIHRHGGSLYTVSPYAMLWNNDLYYMVGHSDARGICRNLPGRPHRRLDRHGGKGRPQAPRLPPIRLLRPDLLYAGGARSIRYRSCAKTS